MPPVTQVHKTLFVPGQGEVYVDRGMEPINRFELQTLARMHEIAQKFEIELRCRRCGASFLGENNDNTTQPAIACHCRELRYLGG